MTDALESLAAFHCAPTLAGIKPASLFTWHPSADDDRSGSISYLHNILFRSGVSVECLCSCEKYALIMLYRKDLLLKVFSPDVESFLEKYGYSRGDDIKGRLDTLKSRLKVCGDFPHEIGVFLGYPLEDVTGFIENKGRGYKLCGLWKVYGDEKSTGALFERYKKCADYFGRRFASGCRIPQLISTSPVF